MFPSPAFGHRLPLPAHAGLGHDANHKVDWRTQNSPDTEAPTITGTAQMGETLTADISDAECRVVQTFSYQWLA